MNAIESIRLLTLPHANKVQYMPRKKGWKVTVDQRKGYDGWTVFNDIKKNVLGAGHTREEFERLPLSPYGGYLMVWTNLNIL